MINDTSQHSAETWFMCGGTFDHYFITDLLLSLFWKFFKIAQHLAKLLEVDCLKCPVCKKSNDLLKDEELA